MQDPYCPRCGSGNAQQCNCTQQLGSAPANPWGNQPFNPGSIMSLYTKDLASQMTKREYFARVALGRLVSSHSPKGAAETAIEYADALIAELEKK